MNFQKKSKPTASVAGRPSPKTLRKNKSTRSTKSEAQVPVKSGHKDNAKTKIQTKKITKTKTKTKTKTNLNSTVGSPGTGGGL